MHRLTVLVFPGAGPCIRGISRLLSPPMKKPTHTLLALLLAVMAPCVFGAASTRPAAPAASVDPDSDPASELARLKAENARLKAEASVTVLRNESAQLKNSAATVAKPGTLASAKADILDLAAHTQITGKVLLTVASTRSGTTVRDGAPLNQSSMITAGLRIIAGEPGNGRDRQIRTWMNDLDVHGALRGWMESAEQILRAVEPPEAARSLRCHLAAAAKVVDRWDAHPNDLALTDDARPFSALWTALQPVAAR